MTKWDPEDVMLSILLGTTVLAVIVLVVFVIEFPNPNRGFCEVRPGPTADMVLQKWRNVLATQTDVPSEVVEAEYRAIRAFIDELKGADRERSE